MEEIKEKISDGNNEFIEKWSFAILCFSLIAIGLFVFRDYLFLKKLFLFKDIGSDTITTFYPHYLHISDYLRTEGIPKWSFNQGLGQNIFPGGVFDPFNLILYALGRNYLAYGIVYTEFLKVILAGIVFYHYLRLLDLTKYTSLLGGLLFAFSGYMILGTSWWATHSSVVLYGAFLLFAFEKFLKQNSWIWIPLAVALVANPKIIFYAEFILLYAIFRFVAEKGWQPKEFFFLVGKVAGLGALGVAISAFWSIGIFLNVLQSPRVTGEVSFVNTLSATPLFFFENPLHYMTVVMRLFSNDLLGTGSNFQGWRNYLEAPSFYCGVISLLLLPQIFIFLSKKNRIIYAIFLAFWVVLIVFPHFRYAFYLYAGNYYKNSLSLFVPVTLLFFSLQAFDKIDKGFKPNLILVFVTLAILLVALFYPYSPISDAIDSRLQFISAGFLVLYTVLMSLSYSAKHRYLKCLVIAGVCIELALFSYITVNRRIAVTSKEHIQKAGYNDYTVDALDYIKSQDSVFYRINKDYFSGTAIHTSWNDAKAQGYYGSPSYSSFNQKWYITFLRAVGLIQQRGEHQTRWCPGLIFSPLMQSFASTKYQLQKKNSFIGPEFVHSTYTPIGQAGDVRILKNNFFLPLGFTYERYIAFKDFIKLERLQKHITLFNAFVIDEVNQQILMHFSKYNTDEIPSGSYDIEKYKNDVGARKRHYLKISEHSQNHIKGTITLEKNQMLFFSIPYDQGWTAVVDGKKETPLLVNIGFMGIIVEAGTHTVELRYRVPYFKTGLIISALSVFIYVLVVFSRPCRLRKGKAPRND